MLHLHQLPGRLRVRSSRLKGNEQLASTAQQLLPSLRGVTSASVNTVTGSVLICYNTKLTHSAPIIRELNRLSILEGIVGFPRPIPSPRPAVSQPAYPAPYAGNAAPQLNVSKMLLQDVLLTAGKIFLLTLLEQSASAAARSLVGKIL